VQKKSDTGYAKNVGGKFKRKGHWREWPNGVKSFVKPHLNYSRKRALVLEQPDLTEVPDHVIAKRCGVSVSCVWRARIVAGLEKKYKNSNEQRTRRRIETAKRVVAHPLIGKIADWKIAAELGLGRTTVRDARTAAGIPPSKRYTKPGTVAGTRSRPSRAKPKSRPAQNFVTASDRIGALLGRKLC
jgi:hypothetical protein